jgi:hypothetical protein
LGGGDSPAYICGGGGHWPGRPLASRGGLGHLPPPYRCSLTGHIRAAPILACRAVPHAVLCCAGGPRLAWWIGPCWHGPAELRDGLWLGRAENSCFRAGNRVAGLLHMHSSRADASRAPPSPLAPGSHAACAFRRLRRARAHRSASRSTPPQRTRSAHHATDIYLPTPPTAGWIGLHTCRASASRDRLAAASHRDPRPHASLTPGPDPSPGSARH